jgi:ornithine cyclodeaminase/alanine dehydrogenase-like protein (mu-crystallin family)
VNSVIVGDDDVRAAVPMDAAIDAVRDAFRDVRAGNFEAPARQVLNDGSLLVMSAYHRPTRSAVVKTLSFSLGRTPSLCGTVGWYELDRPDTLTASAQAMTALRTGAITGVATDLLAPRSAGDMAMIGAGALAHDLVRAVHTVRPLRSLSIHDLDDAKAGSLAARLAEELPGVRVRVAADVREAVSQADVVTCATTSKRPLFASAWLRPEVHVNAVGAFRPDMHELPPELLAESHVVVDDAAACLEEAGEIIDAVRSGLLRRDSLTELSAIIDTPSARSTRTVFKTVGISAQDWAVGARLAEKYLPPR